MHPENILFIEVTPLVSKFDKFIDCKESHPANIDTIDSAKDVLKLVKSIDSNELHPENIESKFFTNDVSKLDKSIDIIFFTFGSLLTSKKFCKFVIDEKYISSLFPS